MRLVVDQLSASLAKTRIVRDVSFEAEGAQFIGLIGPNGVGKTTLLRAIAGLIPFQGSVTLDGTSLAELSPRSRARAIAYLAQGAGSHWPLEVSRLVALGRLPHLAPFRRPGPEDEAAIARALQLAGAEAFVGRDVLALSGGERGRVLLARALAVEAPLLLVDEPVAALDPYHQIRIMEVLRAYADKGRTVIAVLHDLTLAARHCDRLLLLDGGRIKADGAPGAVLTSQNIRETYRVEAVIGEGDERFVLPTRRAE